MILLSIITPHYNMPDTLRRLIDSIPEDDRIEHIIVDDKSDIDGKKLADARAYAAAKGSIWINNDTDIKGTGTCRDLGIQKATGKWIIIADSDDYFTKHAFEIMQRYTDDEADVIYFAPTSIRESDGGMSSRHAPYKKLVDRFVTDPGQESEMRLRYLSVPDTSKMIRRSLIMENGIKSSVSPVANDVMFSVRCAYHAKSVKATSDVVYCITESEGTLTTTKNKERFRKRIDVYIEQAGFLKEHLPESAYADTRISARTLVLQSLMDYGVKEFIHTIKHLREKHAPVNPLAIKVRRR